MGRGGRLGVPRVGDVPCRGLAFSFTSFCLASSVMMILNPVAMDLCAVSLIWILWDLVVFFCLMDFGFVLLCLLLLLLVLAGSFASFVFADRVPEAMSFQTVQVHGWVVIMREQAAGIIHWPTDCWGISSHSSFLLVLVTDCQPIFVEDTFGMIRTLCEGLLSSNALVTWASRGGTSGSFFFTLMIVQESVLLIIRGLVCFVLNR